MKAKGKKALRYRLVQKQFGLCFWCGRPLRSATLDHVVPKSKGGTLGQGNAVAACLQCNAEKGDRSAEEFVRAKLAAFRDFLQSEGFSMVRRG